LYVKTNWVDDVTPISAEKLNNIEQGIFSSQYVSGSYTGDDISVRDIVLGFQPSAIFVITKSGMLFNGADGYGGLGMPGDPGTNNAGVAVVTIRPTGFRVYEDTGVRSNSSWATVNPFRYIAFR